ncbi:helix-turn-helix transcriptional regulator [Clostridium beijerinckii]|uniref:helix-turn-helix transcriptional regulator n=1 Tax=Clostridium beijerinckii TaxID=1520 RepID=UPI00098C5BA5|nr:helix-turn-helix transcriptional regulator [Clostridium beijerinckii]NRT78640.1 transcriptional regulator with XRE-family HTH domain [Clostridium beijerinckii]OOM41365.1 anaerobic benzoate catabolism transcriptional regulator [Clostridium beijerinckii]
MDESIFRTEELKNIIKTYREKANISKSKLSRMIGVSPSYITMLESGEKTNPSLEVIVKISKALAIPPEELADPVTDVIDIYDDLDDLKRTLINEKSITEKEKMLTDHILRKISEMQEEGSYSPVDFEIILNELLYLSRNKVEPIDILKRYITSKKYEITKFNDDVLKDIDRKFSEILELEFYKLNK